MVSAEMFLYLYVSQNLKTLMSIQLLKFEKNISLEKLQMVWKMGRENKQTRQAM